MVLDDPSLPSSATDQRNELANVEHDDHDAQRQDDRPPADDRQRAEQETEQPAGSSHAYYLASGRTAVTAPLRITVRVAGV